jgi:Flp pilus assembly protein TadD
VSALLLSSDIALAEEDIERAKQVSIRLSEIGADPARTTILNARIAATEGRVSDAFALLDKLPPAYSAGTDLRKRLVAATTIDPAEIENQLTSAPKDPQLLGRLCTLYRRSQPGKALEYCRRASEIEPTNMVPAAGYAAALVQLKQFDSAANMLSKLVLIEPDNRTLHANLGTALFELKRFDLAAKQFEWLSASDPTAAAPYYFLAIAYDQTENYVDSLAAYEQYKKLADPVSNKLEIEKVDLRLPVVRGLVKAGKGRKKQ